MSKGKESSAGTKEQGCVSKAQFNVELFMHRLIPIWVDPNDVRLMVDSDNQLNIGLDVGLHSFSRCTMVSKAHLSK